MDCTGGYAVTAGAIHCCERVPSIVDAFLTVSLSRLQPQVIQIITIMQSYTEPHLHNNNHATTILLVLTTDFGRLDTKIFLLNEDVTAEKEFVARVEITSASS